MADSVLDIFLQRKLKHDHTPEYDARYLRLDSSNDPLTGDLEIHGNLYFDNDAGLPYGNVNIEDNSTATTISTQNVWVQVAFDTNGESNLTTPDHTNDHILITKAGKYFISAAFDAHDGGVNDQYEISIYKNNGATQLSGMRTHVFFDFSTSEPQGSFHGIADLAVNDTVEMWVRNTSATDDITFAFANISLTMVGGT